ncbi:hypothetical protein V5O48_011976 [Marasmius crinis-equi]|uniref:CopC domain-containing protein n=1 Tax=Marasmius crinis-equi TaxID=585013 RepID=A0ABR3F417_9AGAR
MRFTATFAALAAAGLVAAQEAARFGAVDVSPSSVAPGDTLNIHYNASLARSHPLFVDFHMQGKFANGNPTPELVLSRNAFGANDIILDVSVPVPPINTLGETNSWLVWADVTFTQDGFNLTGGISTPVTVNQ